MNVQILRTLATSLLITTVAVYTHNLMCTCCYFLTVLVQPPDVTV